MSNREMINLFYNIRIGMLIFCIILITIIIFIFNFCIVIFEFCEEKLVSYLKK